jgi:hypothetical protein
MNYKHDRRKFFAPALLELVLLANLALPAAGRATPPATPYAAAADVISVAEARGLPLGTVVTIDGSVTVPSGAFNSSTGDQGFAIQDHTGGIYASTPDNLGFAPRQSELACTGTQVRSAS